MRAYTWAEGPAVRSAQGTALVNRAGFVSLSAQRAESSPNGRPVGPTRQRELDPFTRALPWAG